MKATKIYARFASEVYDDFGESYFEQEYYRKEHADKEIRKMKHDIWISRAGRAKLEIRYWQSNNRCFFGYRFNVRHEITDEGHYADYWVRLWQRIENLCSEKAKEYE